jgi:acetyl esterase/lipase
MEGALILVVGEQRIQLSAGETYAAPLADVHSPIRFATSHGAEYGARAGPIGVFGLSSGAELALLAARTAHAQFGPSTVSRCADVLLRHLS